MEYSRSCFIYSSSNSFVLSFTSCHFQLNLNRKKLHFSTQEAVSRDFHRLHFFHVNFTLLLATELYCITDSHTVPISRGFQIISLKILSPLHGYKSNMFNTCSIFLWAFCHLYFLLCPFSSWYGRCIFFIGNTNCFQSWFWSFRPRGQLSNKVMR